MNKISKKTLITTLTAISLWIIGSYLLIDEKNDKTTIMIVTIILVAGLYSQIKKDIAVNSKI